MTETRDQALAALEKANQVRTARAKLKRELRAAKISPLDVLRAMPDSVETMYVENFLDAIPNIGAAKRKAILKWTDVPPTRRLGELTDHQRLALARQIKERAWL